MSNFEDAAPPTVDGELWVKPFHPDGSVLSDPYSIFKYPKQTQAFLQERYPSSRLGGFPEAASHIFLGSNLVVDVGRQTLANLIGGKDLPSINWVVTKSSWGTYDTVPRFTDTTLSPQPTGSNAGGLNEIVYAVDGSGNQLRKKPIYSVDWPQAFIVRFEAILESTEANGTLLREMGLWTDNETLFARKVYPAISKNNSFGLSFLWRVRF